MQLTLFTDYSLRVLIYLGVKSRRATIGEIAANFKVSRNHMVKVVHQMGDRGWIRNIKGLGGGVELVIDPKQLKVGDVVRATEKNMNLVECFDSKSNTCPIISICTFQHALSEARHAFLTKLDHYTLYDLIEGPQRKDRELRLGLELKSTSPRS